MQTKAELEAHYAGPDPWGYKKNPDDINRREKIVNLLRDRYQGFARALDIGAGEGWITIGLPAGELWGYELSENARSRMPFGVIPTIAPEGEYDLVVATGVLYAHYDFQTFLTLIKKHSSHVVLTSSMKHAEIELIRNKEFVEKSLGLKEVYAEEFDYFNGQQMKQVLRIFEKI